LHMPISTENTKEFVSNLEERLRSKSDKIEQLHMEAAIDAEFSEMDNGEDEGDSANPNSVANCLSPYVPTKSERIAAFVSWVGLKGETSNSTGDILLDIGCGDGRVCISAAKLSGEFEYLNNGILMFVILCLVQTGNYRLTTAI
jgi:tRNA G46 methylase TrmB